IYYEFLDDEEYSVLELNKTVLRGFTNYLREDRDVKKKTIDNYFSAINALYDYLHYEEYIDTNPIIPFRKRYLNSYKEEQIERQVPEIEEMSRFINSIPKLRDKAIVALFAKTGIRRGELISIDIDDIDLQEYSIELKQKAKRSNRIVFFDHETARILKRWLKAREGWNPKGEALFIGEHGDRLHRHGVYEAVTKWAEKVGLHNPDSDTLKDSFSPHCLRHWFTTWMRRKGMERQFIQELRGDKRGEAIDIYDHIDKKELRQSYMASVPELGII
ncbi:MAG: tyrosine-type recombinase/integrase, partial [Thermoplasmata archaeon]